MIAAAGAPAAPAKASAGQALRGGPPLTLLGHTPVDGLSGLADLAVHRRTAYVGTEDHSGSCPTRGVHVVDLSNPEEPRPSVRWPSTPSPSPRTSPSSRSDVRLHR